MRTVTYGGACSLDMYIAGAGGAMDWLHWSDDAQKIMGEYWATVDTILMGLQDLRDRGQQRERRRRG